MHYEAMQAQGARLWFSPSDLSEYLGCAHATHLSLLEACGERPKTHATNEYRELIFRKGNEHEAAYLAQLQERGLRVETVGWSKHDLLAQAERTAELMRAGVDVIYQGVFVVGQWRGLADFVERVEHETALGSWGYEAVDTKLTRNEALPSHALQLCFYSDGIEQVQGVAPRFAHIELGSGRRESIRLREIAAYYRRARASFEVAVTGDVPTEPFPCDHCQYCEFQRECQDRWHDEDHLTRVAGMRRDQIGRLRDGGVTTMRALATLPAGTTIPDVRPPTLGGLIQQARLQVAGEETKSMPFELLPQEPGRGFARLPRPSAGDIMFDLEGDPFWTPARELTFLFGLLLRDGSGWTYQPFWAHTPDEEQVAFEQCIDLITHRLERWPDLHVFHYSPAEPGAIARLMATHATREVEVDDLLRRGILVDLLTAVKQSMRVGVASYSLKQIEKLAGFTRAAEMGSGADAVLGYEAWRESHDQAELDAIAAYNEEDCRATGVLYDWLLTRRPPDAPWLEPVAKTYDEAKLEEQAEREQLRRALVDGAEEGGERWLAGELLEYHRREARPGWWRYFALRGMDQDELVGDGEALAGLTPAGARAPDGRSELIPLAFAPQNHKIGVGTYEDLDGTNINVVKVDDEAGVVTIRRGKRSSDKPLPSAILPRGPYDMRRHQGALLDVAKSVRDDDGRFPALRALLRRDPPRFAGIATGAAIQTTAIEEQRRLARDLDRSTLIVQGPPGTGKTWTGARLVIDLIGRGHRVGITALSHKAINNFVEAIEDAADEEDFSFVGARKATEGDDKLPDRDGQQVVNVGDNGDCRSQEFRLVAATSWLFVDERFRGAFDYLVIDEAGQMSLADALAAGTSAENLILLGDPLQLPQVSQAIHPAGTNASVLEHLLDSDTTIPPDRGLFLTESWRMHPTICQFISEEVYDGRLKSYGQCAVQSTGAGTGIRYDATPHAGNASQSREEADAINAAVTSLLGQSYTPFEGPSRQLVAADMMVVAPYNAQVRMLRHVLPAGVRIGTVDKFQGQEAPVVFFSMATSTGEDAPRHHGFLFSRNRLNVAISRARCLAYLVCNPALLDTKAKSIEDMRLISTLCSLVEAAEPAPRTGGT